MAVVNCVLAALLVATVIAKEHNDGPTRDVYRVRLIKIISHQRSVVCLCWEPRWPPFNRHYQLPTLYNHRVDCEYLHSN